MERQTQFFFQDSLNKNNSFFYSLGKSSYVKLYLQQM